MSKTDAYLGNPSGAAGMILLPPLGQNVRSPWSDADTRHDLASGGVAVTRMPRARRSYTLAWPVLTPRQAAIPLGFKVRTFGAGPFALLDPSWPNLLTTDASPCSAAIGSAFPWTATGGGAAAVADTAPPEPEMGGVIAWTATAGGVLANASAGTDGPDADPRESVPYVPELPYTLSVYTRATAAGTGKLRALGLNGDGSGTVVASSDAAINLGTTWQRQTLTLAAAALGASRYIVLALAADAAASVSVAAPQVNAGAPAAEWSIGNGCPRVLPVGDADHGADVITTHDVTLTLVEV